MSKHRCLWPLPLPPAGACSFAEKPLAPHIQLPSADIQEHQLVTLTCSVNFSCWENPIQLQWSLDGTVVQETILTTKLVSTQSKLTFTPQWTHHGQNLTCQLQNATERHVLSEDTVRLDVKRECPRDSSGKDAVLVTSSLVTALLPAAGSGPGRAVLSHLPQCFGDQVDFDLCST